MNFEIIHACVYLVLMFFRSWMSFERKQQVKQCLIMSRQANTVDFEKQESRWSYVTKQNACLNEIT